ncbi:MAG: hypothetical protein R3D71_08355 [Rickettsiales bacterium]
MPYEDTEQHADRVKRQEQNEHDLQNEIADRDVGRQKRFMVSGERITLQQEKEKREQFHTLTALELLLLDLEYLALYNETTTLITDVMSITEEELKREHKQLKILTENRDNIRCNANRLADGRLVFRNKLGDVIAENDEVITDQVALDGIVWRDDAPTYEEYKATTSAIDKTSQNIDDLTRYQIEILGAAKLRLEDENSPPSKEEVQEIKRDVYEQAPEVIKNKLDASDVAANPHQNMSHEITAFKM